MRFLNELLAELRRHPGRSALNVLGLTVAILAIVCIAATALVTRDVFVAKAEQANGRRYTVGAVLATGSLSVRRLSDLERALAALTKQGAGVAVTAEVTGSVGDSSAPMTIELTDGELPQIRRLPMMSGRWLSTRYPGGIVVNRSAGQALGGTTRAPVLHLSDAGPGVREPIIGVVADGLTTPRIYLPMVAALAVDPTVLAAAEAVTISVHAAHTGPAVLMAALSNVLASIGVGDEVEVTRLDTTDELSGSLFAQRRAFELSGLAALVVAIVGLANIGLAAATQRSRETALRRAIGAHPASIFMIVLLSGVVLGLCASGAAVAMAWLGVRVLAPRLIDPASGIHPPGFPFAAAELAILTGLVASAFGALLPAIRATRVDIMVLLRD